MSDYKYMMATRAQHRMGDISNDSPDLCVVNPVPVYVSDPDNGIEGECYVGQWVTGFGFINVKFPVETTRDLTEAEIEYYHGKGYQIGKMYLGEINVRDHS